MSRVYLAASYSRRLAMCEYAAALRVDGHTVTSRWLSVDDHTANVVPLWDDTEMHPESVRIALDDHADIIAADTLVAFTEPVRTIANSRGGRHVELGLAYAHGKRIILVGKPEHVFHLLPSIKHVATWEQAKALLTPTLITEGTQP